MQNIISDRHPDSPLKAHRLKSILLILFLVLMDQGTKYLAILYLKGNSGIPLINHVLTLRYLENRGMAFGLLQDQVLFLVLICIVFFVGIIYFFIKIPATVYYSPLLFTAVVVFTGAVGNFIDRVFRGFVVDFIYFSLSDFPIFNVADIYVTCGIVVLIFLIFFRYKDEDDFDFLKPGL